MGRPEPRGEPCAEIDQRHESRPRPGSAVLTARKPPSGGELRPTEGTRGEKTHRQGLDPMRMIQEPVASGKCRISTGTLFSIGDVTADGAVALRNSASNPALSGATLFRQP